ncbi:MAG: TonB-dependent receptor [Bacteroidota bacterium]
MKERIFLLITILTLSFAGYSQSNHTISGYVKEKLNGEELIGVNIIVGGFTGTVTNEYGFYSITVPHGIYNLKVSYLGFKPIDREVDLTQDIKIDFELEEDNYELEEVQVTSSKQKQTASVRSTEMSVVQLSSKTVKRLPITLGEPDVIRSLQLLPGVSSVNDAATGFNVRGGSADQNLVLLDDGPIYNASHIFGFFSVFNSNAIKDVKLYKGGIPAIYGGRLSSVLDVKQREGNIKDFSGEVGIGTIAANLLLEGPIAKKENGEGKGSFMLAGRRTYADLFTGLVEDLDGTTANFYDLNLKANYNLNEKNRIFLSGYFGRDRFELESFLGTVWGNATGTLRWTSILNEKLFLQTSAIYSNYDYNLDNLRSGSEFTWSSNIVNYILKPRLSWYINSNNTLRTGIDFTYYDFNPGEIGAIEGSSINPQQFQEKRAIETAAYVDFKQNLSDKFSFQYGIRVSNFNRIGQDNVLQYETGNPLTYNAVQDIWEENEVIGTESFSSGESIENFYGFEPRFSARYLVNDDTSLKFSYNRNYQYIHLISNTTSPTPLDIWAPSGQYLEPQYADQFALGYFKSLKDGEYDFNVEAYYKEMYDVTDFIDGADLLFTENIETQVVQGDARAYGLELQLSKNRGDLTGWLSYTLARSERQILGINNNEYYPSNNDQLHELNLVGMYKLNSRWDFSANWIFGSGRPVTFPTSRYSQNGLVVGDYQNRNGDRLPAYHRLDVAATLNPKKGRKGKWIFSIANLYNRLNAASIYFNEVSEVNDVEVATGETQATRLAFFGIVPSVMYQFKF